jgi:hypothetical protein
MELSTCDANDWLLLAMAQSRLGNHEEARTWFDKAVAWIETNEPNHEGLARYRMEAANLLGLPEPSTPKDRSNSPPAP